MSTDDQPAYSHLTAEMTDKVVSFHKTRRFDHTIESASLFNALVYQIGKPNCLDLFRFNKKIIPGPRYSTWTRAKQPTRSFQRMRYPGYLFGAPEGYVNTHNLFLVFQCPCRTRKGLGECCGHPISVTAMARLLSMEERDKLEAICQKQVVELLVEQNMFLYCPTTGCPGAESGIPIPNHCHDEMRCPECEMSVCLKCKHQHSGFSCEQAESIRAHAITLSEEEIQLLISNVRVCPGCTMMIEKLEGCDHMTCTECGVHFCWSCMDRLGSNNPYGVHITLLNNEWVCRKIFDHGREHVDGMLRKKLLGILGC